MGEENEQCLYRSERGERSGAWNYMFSGHAPRVQSTNPRPRVIQYKGARGSGAVPRFKVQRCLTEAPRYRPHSTAPVAGATTLALKNLGGRGARAPWPLSPGAHGVGA